jgi:hypothetical protein
MVVLALALVRYIASLHEDDNIHIGSGQAALVTKQMAFFSRVEAVERWGKSLTIIALIGGLALAALYLNQVFQGNANPLG